MDDAGQGFRPCIVRLRNAADSLPGSAAAARPKVRATAISRSPG